MDILSHMIECARNAGAIAMSHFRDSHGIDVHNKVNDSDIVTIADKECETFIINHIKTYFPGHAILSEESGATSGVEDYRWVIDPIDGTTNFFSGIPIWAISIGLEHHGEREAGVVFLPATEELFYAVKGKGAFLNGKRINVCDVDSLSKAVISTGFPIDKDTNPDNNLDNLSVIMPKVRDIRRLGSAAADMCYVAAGFLGGYWELNLHEWDISAASVILSEAGGLCTRFREDRNISLVCGNPVIHDRLLALLHKTPRRE